MPTNKLPTLSGEDRELRDYSYRTIFVKLSNGAAVPVEVAGDGSCTYEDANSDDYPVWNSCGTPSSGTEHRIVLILGPAEETHGDGTVTKLKTVLASGHPEFVDRLGRVVLNDSPNPDWRVDINQATVHYRKPPTPQPSYQERLIEAVKAGTVVLPPGATHLVWHHNLGANGKGMWFWLKGEINPRQNWQWQSNTNGPLPPRQECDPDTIDLAPVREALEGRG